MLRIDPITCLIPNVEVIKFLDRLDIHMKKERKGERKGKLKAAFEAGGLSHWKNGVSIDCYWKDIR